MWDIVVTSPNVVLPSSSLMTITCFHFMTLLQSLQVTHFVLCSAKCYHTSVKPFFCICRFFKPLFPLGQNGLWLWSPIFILCYSYIFEIVRLKVERLHISAALHMVMRSIVNAGQFIPKDRGVHRICGQWEG